MPEDLTCSNCGAPITPPNVLCPKCLLALAFADELRDRAATAVALPVPQPGDRIGRYKLLEKIGEGGCGLVYMAEQHEPVRRRVALKVIKLGMETREVLARFEAERQALALMEHPNIASVFDGGTTDTGRPYFVMELVRGIPITDYCDEHKLSTRERLEIFQQVCRAVQHAHQKGIIHRDLKPSNVLVTINDGIPVPKVIDFGIAKATGQQLTDKTFFTRFRQLLGTPAYMSPEQAQMTSLDIDTRSDVYSLGVLLYELLIGRTPFDSQDLIQAGLEEMLRIIREREPPRPSARLTTLAAGELTTVAIRRQIEPPKLIDLLRGDLDWVVMKCLEKDRGRRYDTANGLAHDIERHLRSEPVEARPPSVSYRVNRFVQRHRLVVGATSLVIISLLTATIISIRMAGSANKARKIAEEQEGKADIARNAEENESYAARIGLALTRLEHGAPEQAKPLLDGAATRLRGWEWFWLNQYVQAFPQSHHDITAIWFAAFSPDARHYVLAGRDTALADQKIVVWSSDHRQSWTVTNDIPGHLHLVSVGFTADSQRAFAGISTQLSFWNLSASNQVSRFLLPTGHIFAVSATGDRLVSRISRQDSDEFSFWDTTSELASPHLLSTITNRLLPGPPIDTNRFVPPPPRVILSSDLRRMLTEDGRVDSNTLAKIKSPRGLNDAMFLQRRIWDTDGGRVLVTWPESRFAIMERLGSSSGDGSAYFSPDRTKLLMIWPSHTSRFPGSRARVYETDTGRQISTWNCGQRMGAPWRIGVVFSPAADHVAITREFFDRANTQINVIDVWNVATGRLLSAFQIRSLQTLAFLSNGVHLATSDSTGQLNFWDIHTGRAVSGLLPKPGYFPIVQPVFSPDSRQMLSSPRSASKPCLWDLHTSEASLILSPLSEPPTELSPTVATFSPDGERVACASEYRRYSVPAGPRYLISLYSLASGHELATIKTKNEVIGLRFSSDGERIIAHERQATTNDLIANIIVLYELPTGRELKRLQAPWKELTPDGRRILAINHERGEFTRFWFWPLTNSNTLQIWDTSTGELVTTRDRPGDYYDLTGDNRFIVQLGADRKLLDPITLKPVASVPQDVRGPVWFFPRVHRILAGVGRESSASSNVRPAMVLFDSESQRPIVSWDVAATLRWPTTLRWPIWDRGHSTSADQQRCVLLAGTASAFVLDTQTGKRLCELVGHGDRIEEALIFPDGKRVLTASTDGTAKLWDADTGREILTFPCPLNPGRSMAYAIGVSQDGQRLLTVDKTGVIVRSAVPGLGAARLSTASIQPPLEPDPQLYATRYGTEEVVSQMQAMGAPLRDPRTPPQQLDLSLSYNNSFQPTWVLKDPDESQQRNYSLSSLPRQRRTFAGTEFDARGIVLPDNGRVRPGFSRSLPGRDIDVRRYCKRIHFLHATIGKDKEGVHSAHYFIHDASGATNTIHIAYGEDLRDCTFDDKPLTASRSTVAWQGKTEKEETLRLFKTTWDNPQPEVEIETIDFESGKSEATPFLMAITIDDAEAPAWNTLAAKVPK